MRESDAEDDPSLEWTYDKVNDMWISFRQQVAIEGATYRDMVAARASEASRQAELAVPQAPGASPDQLGPAGGEDS